MLLRTIFALVLACAAAMAQAQKVARIGILSPVSLNDPETRAQYSAFAERMRERGYEEGKTLVLEWRFAEGRFEILPLLAGELVKARVDVIVANGTASAAAAKRATATIPIVATSMGDPVASGFAESLERPGRNVTGFTAMGSAVYVKRLELLTEALPAATRIGLIVHADDTFFLQVFPGLKVGAQRRGRELIHVNVREERDLREGFAMLASRRVEAVLVGDDRFLGARGGAIAGLALQYKMATVFPTLRGAEQGGLFGYPNDLRNRHQSAADYVDRILKGASPGELPIVPPTKFDLAVNRKTAAALGIALPDSILTRASKVIE